MDPEDEARQKIDQMLRDSGWTLQDRKDFDLGERFVAVREYPLGKKAADYVLFIDRYPVGVIEAKRVGFALSGVMQQCYMYLDELIDKFPRAPRKPSFAYASTGIETLFTDRQDPDHRSRHVFTFHRPEILIDWLGKEKTLRARLKEIPPLRDANLWDCQRQAIENLEKSFSHNKPKALIQMATGSGKTFTAVTFLYRLIKFADAKRILFLVDRGNLQDQARREFQNYVTPDDGRKFTDLYNVQALQTQQIDPSSKVVISTVQRMYSILKGDETFDETSDEFSEFEQDPTDGHIKEVKYNSEIPVGEFDFIVIDECHRSIYNKWKQVLDYFDSFLIGLTATPSKHTIGFFDNNQVMEYGHRRAVADGINVGYHVYKIMTKLTKEGNTIEAGEIVEKRDKLTRDAWQATLDEDYIYRPRDLNESVLAPGQIRLIIKTFKENLPHIFPERKGLPKTLIFAKDDNHAEEITRITKEVFNMGDEFCQKITYKTTGRKPSEILKEFRNSPLPRIAVTVDMIATGTDIKPLECIIFMRDVKSKLYFDQMKGRGTRTISNSDLRAVTPDAVAKSHFVIVDTVGVCEHAMSETNSLNRKNGVSLERLLESVAEGRVDEDDLESLAYRLSRLDKRLNKQGKQEISDITGGTSISQLVNKILDGVDPDEQIQRAKVEFKTEEPTEEQKKIVVDKCILDVCKLFDSAKLRRTIIDVKRQNEIILDPTIDTIIEFGPYNQATKASENVIENFKEFLDKNKDELTALKIIYSKPYNLRKITFDDIRKLADAIKNTPDGFTPELLWNAYKRLDKSKVKDNPVKILTDLISIIRYSIGHQELLIPFVDMVNEKFEQWLTQQKSLGRTFTPEQEEWLEMIKEHISSSITISLEDMDLTPFNQKGGRAKFYKIFGNDYEKILEELQDVVANQ